MDCGICLNDCILEKDMHYTECMHYFCFECFKQLLTESCPFCRRTITLIPIYYSVTNIENNENNVENDIIFEDDFIIPIIRKNRQEYKRNKINRRKKRLNDLLNESININIFFPNNKSRFTRKLRSIKF